MILNIEATIKKFKVPSLFFNRKRMKKIILLLTILILGNNLIAKDYTDFKDIDKLIANSIAFPNCNNDTTYINNTTCNLSDTGVVINN